MAEILLSLTIIGVVAAITLPSLTGNINERTWNTQRKALYARFSQAIALMPALNGYGTLTEGDSSTSAVDTAAETFITDGLAKVLKINNICDSDHLADCGIADKLTNLVGSIIEPFPQTMVGLNEIFNGVYVDGAGASIRFSQTDTKAAAFETVNGESIVVYYNPNCISDMNETSGRIYMQKKLCANFIYDLNGNKGPNTVGKDIGFISALYPTDSVVVAPLPLQRDAGTAKQTDAGKLCTQQDSDSRLPNIYELASIFYNRKLTGLVNGWRWSSTVASPGYGWYQNMGLGNREDFSRDQTLDVRCIKR